MGTKRDSTKLRSSTVPCVGAGRPSDSSFVRGGWFRMITHNREMADKVSPEERDERWERIYTYRKWLLDNVLREGTVLVLPVDEGKPNYRDAPPP